MIRYRPPPPPKSPYITAEGARNMRSELKHLWEVERPIVTDAVHEAAKNGDRSENGDYIYGKQRLRKIDSRVRYLSKRLENAVIVSSSPSDDSKVFFSAYVTLEQDDGSTLSIRIVGCDEIDAKRNWISCDSPMAKALLGKSIGDDIHVDTPTGTNTHSVLDIRYDDPQNN
ncbi:MAG: transcription elongation factor GreB [Pseudomonadota bacterium]